MALALRLYLEDNAGGWRDVTERLRLAGVGEVAYLAEAESGNALLSPPSRLRVENGDGWWLTEPARAGGEWQGSWEGRRARLYLVSASAQLTLGTFRISPNAGFVTDGYGEASLKLESLCEPLRQGDAAEVGLYRGWYTDLPWTLAVDKLRRPEDLSALTYPNAMLDYFGNGGLERGASSLGRPGDYTAAGFAQVTAKAVDVCYNETSQVFCFATHEGLVEWSPETGLYSPVSLAFSLLAGHDILRVWWAKGGGSNVNWYLVLTGMREVSDLQQVPTSCGYYQPLDQKAEGCRALVFYKHNRAAYLVALPSGCSTAAYRDYYPGLAPVIYRHSPFGGYGTGTVHATFGGDRQPTTGNERLENLAIPFAQYVFPLITRRRDTNDNLYYYVPGLDLDVIEYKRVAEESVAEGGHDALYSDHEESDQTWQVVPDAPYPAAQEFHDSMLRSGRGYYQVDIDWGTTGYSGPYWGGARYSLGQGPLLDVSFPASASSYDDGLGFFLAYCAWERSASFKRWHICLAYVRGSLQTAYVDAGGSVALAEHTAPTFVRCEVNGYSNLKGYLLFGWHDYYGTNEGGSPSWRSTRAGVGIYPLSAVYTTAAPDLSATSGRQKGLLLSYGGAEGGAYVEKGYSSGAEWAGRWTPVAMGARQSFAGSTTSYSCLVVCLDRMECQLSKSNKRVGLPYRLGMLNFQHNVGTDAVSAATFTPMQQRYSLPPMGLTRVLEGEVYGDTSSEVWLYSPADRALYSWAPGQSTNVVLRDTVPLGDGYLGLGLLAVGNDGDRANPRLCGVSSPCYPLTGPERWPVGEYKSWYYGEAHSGRIPLLDGSSVSKWEAIRMATELADSLYYLDRAGGAVLRRFPSYGDAEACLLTPADYESGKRSLAAFCTYAMRSVSNLAPSEPSITVLLGPYSEWNLVPDFTGFDVYPVELELRCVQGGLVTAPSPSNDPFMGQTLWAFRYLARRLTSSLTADAAAGGYTVTLETVEELDPGDRITLSSGDAELEVASVNYSTNVVTLTTALAFAYSAGAPTWTDKKGDGTWSWPSASASGTPKGVAKVLTAASIGAARVRVSSLEAIGLGNLVAFGSATTKASLYRVTKLYPRRSADESVGASTEQWLELQYIDAGALYDGAAVAGLQEAVASGAEVFVLLTLPPGNRTTPVGGTGLHFAALGEGSTSSEDDEKPVLEGDRIQVSYAGLELARDSHSKAVATDPEGVALYGKEKPKGMKANRYMDSRLASLDVQRRVVRGSQPRVQLSLKGVGKAEAQLLEPWAVVRVKDRGLLQERTSSSPKYSAPFVVLQHRYRPDSAKPDLLLQELLEEAGGAAPLRGHGTLTQGTLDSVRWWAKADALSGYSDTDPVPSWPDVRGAAFPPAEQSTASYRPLYRTGIQNGKPGLWFDGSNDLLSLGDLEVHSNEARGWPSAGLTVYVVGLRDASKSFLQAFLGKLGAGGTQNQWTLRPDVATVQEVLTPYDNTRQVAFAMGSAAELLCMAWQPAGKVEAYRGLTSLGVSAANVASCPDGTGALLLGSEALGFFYLKGYLFEVMLAGRYHATAEREAVSAYLASEWAL